MSSAVHNVYALIAAKIENGGKAHKPGKPYTVTLDGGTIATLRGLMSEEDAWHDILQKKLEGKGVRIIRLNRSNLFGKLKKVEIDAVTQA